MATKVKPKEIAYLIGAREAARDIKDYDRADSYREALALIGIKVDDTPYGTKVDGTYNGVDYARLFYDRR